MDYKECTRFKPHTIFVGTFNVNNSFPKEPLKEWLSTNEESPDLYAIGFQEIDLSKESFICTDTNKLHEWSDAIKAALHSTVNYKTVTVLKMFGIAIMVFVKEELYEFVDNVSTATVKTGLMKSVPNKGCVAVSLEFHSRSICLINCHFTAHLEKCAERNKNFQYIYSHVSFNEFRPPKYIDNHEHIYWMGDLNYRIDLDCEAVKELAQKNLYEVLLKHDQLLNQKLLKNIFVGFNEGTINFPPTYKYDIGTIDKWDSSDKNRTPAWCDRILFKGQNITQLHYKSYRNFTNSDHKPVSSLFTFEAKIEEKKKQHDLLQNVIKCLDDEENTFLPFAKLNKSEVIFNNVHFMERQEQNIAILNKGTVPVIFQFLPKLNESNYCKNWLKITPDTSLLQPGENCDIKFEIFIDNTMASYFNCGLEKIKDTLILNLKGGNDFFIDVSGTYVPSVFGTSLECLVRLSEPIARISVDNVLEIENSKSKQPLFAIPKELYALFKHLNKYGLNEKNLFSEQSWHNDFQKIRHQIDNGIHEYKDISLHGVAAAILLFLESLPEPVIPYNYYDKALKSSNDFKSCIKLIEEIPVIHKKSFSI